MKLVIDIETEKVNLDRGEKPKHIWLVICKDMETGQYHTFRNLTENNENECERFRRFISESAASSDSLLCGHNLLGFDWPVLVLTFEFLREVRFANYLDTLILSRLIDYPRKGHSIEDYGEEFGIPKGDNSPSGFFSKWSQELEDYCIVDVDICHKIYNKYRKYINDPLHDRSIKLEHDFQFIVNDLHDNGFAFNADRANKLLASVEQELQELDQVIERDFKPREVLIREFTPKATKFGTISKSSVPRVLHDKIHEYEVGKTYRHTKLEPFNPSSHKQLVEVLHEAGWQPEDKTQTHIDTEREIARLKHSREENKALDLDNLNAKLNILRKTGYKINEKNLSTLPDDAPSSARSLAKRILLEARRRTLTEWLGLVQDDGRIHGKFQGIGAWTHRMAHQQPNTANIPNEFDTEGKVKLLGKEMRQLWRAPRNRLLVGVDAEGIQLRIFAHYIDDPEFTEALIKGKKDDKTDPHSLNQRIIGETCKSRAAAKRFIYAMLLGAGVEKLASILNTDRSGAEQALERLMERYQGFAALKKTVIPNDAKRGWFIGLDGRKVRIVGDTVGERKHLCMSGYLQNGEQIIIKDTAVRAKPKLIELDRTIKFVDIVHDEYVIEVPNNVVLAKEVMQVVCDTIEQVGVDLNLKCPLKGDGGYGVSWYNIH